MRQILKENLLFFLKHLKIGANPDFIIIGAQKAGTTSLYNYLQQNPQVCRCLKKEVHYFDLNYDKRNDWYEAHFFKKKGSNRCIIGEASPLYLYHPHVPLRLKSAYPNIKLIVLLRDPVNRAISHYRHLLRHSLIPDHLSFNEVVKIEKQKRRNISANSYFDPIYSVLHRGEYIYQLRRWFLQFERDQFLILRNENFLFRPEKILRKVDLFLNLKAYNYDISRKYNVSRSGKVVIRKSDLKMLNDHFKNLNTELSELLDDDFVWETTDQI